MAELHQIIAGLGTDITVLGPDDLASRDPGWDGANLGASALAMPASTEAAARLVRWCAENNVQMVSQGGRTGLTGAGRSAKGQVILSTAKLATIHEIDPLERVAVVGAGVTLQTLQEACAPHGLEPGIDLAARGSATIGGMLSTNAGGILAFRNGVMRHRLLGIEVVLPDGSVMTDLTRVVKTSAGYDLKHLFVGAEGTLGFITRAVLKLDALIAGRASAMVGVKDAASALRIIRHFLGLSGAQLCGAELMWQDFARFNAAAHGVAAGQVPLDAPAVLLLELASGDGESAREMLEEALGALWDEAGILDAVVAQSLDQRDRLWHLREDTETIYRHYPGAASYDVSVPASLCDAYVARIREGFAAIDPALKPYVFGHIADGNLHIIFNRPGALDDELSAKVDEVLYTGLAGQGGSFSAEHGVGVKKRRAYELYADPVKQAVARSIKATLDPNNLFNPGKVVAL